MKYSLKRLKKIAQEHDAIFPTKAAQSSTPVKETPPIRPIPHVTPISAAATSTRAVETPAIQSTASNLPEPLLFILADYLLKDMDGLKEITELFTQRAHQEKDPIKHKQKILEV